MAADHYRLLGVTPSADPAEIRAAYLHLMRACHPDLRPGDLAAAETARQANVAWRVLRDPARRAAYDRQLRAAAPPVRAEVAPATTQAAYLARRRAYGQAFHRACLKAAMAVFASGLLLLAFAAR